MREEAEVAGEEQEQEERRSRHLNIPRHEQAALKFPGEFLYIEQWQRFSLLTELCTQLAPHGSTAGMSHVLQCVSRY